MIRMQYVVGNGVQLAGELGISSSVVYDVINGRTWSHV